MGTAAVESVDIILIGAGIMSATLAAFLKTLEPDLNIVILEKLDSPAQESSHSWNNAGTGHAGLCEVNYTPENAHGQIDIAAALAINTEFDISRQLWAYLVHKGAIDSARSFIHPVPHMVLVDGEANCTFLKKRFDALTAHFCFHGMEFSTDPQQITQWAPLIMEGRDPKPAVAATHMVTGTDVDYGALTRHLIDYVVGLGGCTIHYNTTVTNLSRKHPWHSAHQQWSVETHDTEHRRYTTYQTPFVFIGAGGGALPLLQKSGIPESHGYAGFPVSGIWLRCNDETLANRHHAKVYGKAAVGAPPMSVPHLDHRVINGKHALLFGPFAGATTKFLKHGSHLALLKSIKWDNIGPMASVALDNIQLIEYLAGQVVQSEHHRFASLRQFYPKAHEKDWVLQPAGERVQIIERASGHKEKGVLKLGTEIVSAADHSLVALLGASPGASTAAWIALNILQRCFADNVQGRWAHQLSIMIPSLGYSLQDDEGLYRKISQSTAEILGLKSHLSS